MLDVGFIGLGLMGYPIAKLIAEKTDTKLHVWNRSQQKVKQLSEEVDCIVYDDPYDVFSEAELIVFCVTDAQAMREIIFNDLGYFDNLDLSGKFFIDHSTIAPVDAIDFEKELANSEVTYIDAPITGSVTGAKKGELVVFAGTTKSVLTPYLSVLASYSKQIKYGEKIGNGQVIKLCNQLMLLTTLVASFESVNFAKANLGDSVGISEVLSGTMIDSKAFNLFSKCAEGNTDFMIAHIKDVLKDISYVKDAALLKQLPTPLTDKILHLFSSLCEQGYGGNDLKYLNKLYAKK